MIIIGAGMAGLIAANYFRKLNPVVYEKQLQLPDNHGALLRFRSDKVFRTVGMQGRKVTVRKEIAFHEDFVDRPNVYVANAYSQKVVGRVEDRSIWNMAPSERWIAPPDFLEKMALGCEIEFGQEFLYSGGAEPVISTIPMPVLMKQLGWSSIPEFKATPIWSLRADYDNINVNQTIYFPHSDVPYYRASFVGSTVIIEFVRDPGDAAAELLSEVIDFFGIDEKIHKPITTVVKKQALGKIAPIDQAIRKEFMHWATSKFNIYSLGRFATWRPILLDDVVDDVVVIERMMQSNYETLRSI